MLCLQQKVRTIPVQFWPRWSSSVPEGPVRLAAAARKQAHRAALKLAVVIEDAEAALAAPPNNTQPAGTINPQESGEAVFRRLLADDEAERLMGDDRRRTVLVEHSEELGTEVVVDRAAKWPNLEPLRPASGFGMQVDQVMGHRAGAVGPRLTPRLVLHTEICSRDVR